MPHKSAVLALLWPPRTAVGLNEPRRGFIQQALLTMRKAEVWEAFHKTGTLAMLAKANIVSEILGNTRYLHKEQRCKGERRIRGESPDETVCLPPLVELPFSCVHLSNEKAEKVYGFYVKI